MSALSRSWGRSRSRAAREPAPMSSTRSGGPAERPARWRSLYFMVSSSDTLTRQRSILWTTHRMPRMPEGEGGEARGRLSCSRVISLWWPKDPMVLSHSRSESWGTGAWPWERSLSVHATDKQFGIAKNQTDKARATASEAVTPTTGAKVRPNGWARGGVVWFGEPNK